MPHSAPVHMGRGKYDKQQHAKAAMTTSERLPIRTTILDPCRTLRQPCVLARYYLQTLGGHAALFSFDVGPASQLRALRFWVSTTLAARVFGWYKFPSTFLACVDVMLYRCNYTSLSGLPRNSEVVIGERGE